MDEQIREQNPWWVDPEAIRRDRLVVQRDSGPFRWSPPALEAIDLQPGAVHTLRGPRQVGKSTTVKSLIERLLAAGERRVLYFAFDLARDNDAIAQVIRRARALHPRPEGRWYLFLDEVTTVPDWQLAMKYAVDQGLVGQATVLCTGSSARQMGAEQLTGRRGAGRDYVQLPVSFRDFCTAVMGIALPAETHTVGGLITPDGLATVRELYLRLDALRPALDIYGRIGGFPAAITDYLEIGSVTEQTVNMLWSMVAGDVQQAGRDSVAALKLLERIGRSLGSPISWQALAEAMDAGSNNTAREYVTLLAESFAILTVYFWDLSDNSLKPQKQRKLYYIDPLLDAVPSTIMPGARRAPPAGLVENLVASALYRSATDRLVQAAPVPGAVGVWRSSGGGEIDFVVGERVAGCRSPRFPVEVKGDARTGISYARRTIRSVFGRGIIATTTRFEPAADVPAIPVSVLLAALRERPIRSGIGAVGAAARRSGTKAWPSARDGFAPPPPHHLKHPIPAAPSPLPSVAREHPVSTSAE